MLIHKPAGPVSSAFMLDNSPRATIVGPFASGKSVACVLRLLRHAHEQAPGRDGVRRSRWLVVRQTYKNLQDALLPTWKAWVPEEVYGPFEGTKMRHVLRGAITDPQTGKPDGTTLECEVLFRAMDDPAQDLRNLLSLELTGCWVNECKELDFEIYTQIMTRVNRFPAAATGATPSWSGVIADSNPWPESSPYHRRFVVAPPDGYKLFHQPSGLSAAAENVGNLSPSYYQDMARDLADDPDKVATQVRSEWGVSRSGQAVYGRTYRDVVHCRNFELPKGAAIRVGIDFGIRASAATLMHRSPIGGHFVFDELVRFDCDLPTFADELLRLMSSKYPGHPFEYAVGDPAGGSRNLSGQTAFAIMRARGLPARAAPTNELAARIAAVNRLLTSMAPDGTPAFTLHPRCRWLREGFVSEYMFAKTRNGRIQDVPRKDDWSHVHDSLQYVALSSVGAIHQAHGAGTSGVMSDEQFKRGCQSRSGTAWDPFNI